MPGKSRRRKGKYSVQSTRKKSRHNRPAVLVQPQAVAQAHVPASTAGTPAPVTKLVTVRYQYITTELRTIGILAGIMLIILIVLAFVPLPW